MKNKVFVLIATILIVSVFCSACGTPISVEGTWYSTVDATMYNFSDGEVTVAGVVVGQYENEEDMVVLSLIDDTGNKKLFITELDGVEVLADVREGEGKIYFCRGIENAETMIKEAAQQELDRFESFPDYLGQNLVGEWTPIEENAEYQSIVITEDGTLTFTKPSGEVWVQKLVLSEDGSLQGEDLRIVERGRSDNSYNSPTVTIFMSDDGTDDDINKMSVFACRETYNEDFPALGFYSWTYKKEQ